MNLKDVITSIFDVKADVRRLEGAVEALLGQGREMLGRFNTQALAHEAEKLAWSRERAELRRMNLDLARHDRRLVRKVEMQWEAIGRQSLLSSTDCKFGQL